MMDPKRNATSLQRLQHWGLIDVASMMGQLGAGS